MKKITILIGILFLLISCNNINENNKKIEENIFNEQFQGIFSVDGVIVKIENINNKGGEKLKKIVYSNFDELVIEMGSSAFLDGIENYKGKELLIHIGYDIWKKNSIEILNKLKDLKLKSISINIRDNYINNNAKDIKTIVLKKEEAILFKKIQSQYKNLGLTIGRYGNGEIICSDEVLKILGMKKEDCFYIQMKNGKPL